MIVSDIAGTTRDAVDTKVTWNGKEYIFIDTAGLRRKAKVKEEIERLQRDSYRNRSRAGRPCGS